MSDQFDSKFAKMRICEEHQGFAVDVIVEESLRIRAKTEQLQLFNDFGWGPIRIVHR
jgi:hypothetical protein